MIEIIEYLENYMTCIKKLKNKKNNHENIIQIKNVSPEQIYNDKKIKKELRKNTWVTFQDASSIIKYLYEKIPKMLFFEVLMHFSAYGEKYNKSEITQACKEFIRTHINKPVDCLELNSVYSNAKSDIKEITINEILKIKDFNFNFIKKVNSEIKKFWEKFVFFNEKGNEFWSNELVCLYLGIEKSRLKYIKKRENWKTVLKGQFRKKEYYPAIKIKKYNTQKIKI